MPEWIEREVLITVKAYPEPSVKYKETCCTAGISKEDGWLRLYPVRFRHLPRSRQFTKYQIVKLRMTPHPQDGRPESYRPDEESFQPGRVIGPEHGWAERRQWVLPTASTSMCEIQARQRENGISLGVFKPRVVKNLIITPTSAEWSGRRKAAVSQLWFDDLRGKNRIEKIPFEFKYRYFCEDTGCRGHNQRIIDWELGELCRRLKKERLASDGIKEKIRKRYIDTLCGTKRETYFFVGNHSRYRKSFMVLGVFWPSRREAGLFPELGSGT